MKKRTIIILCLGWITTVAITAFVAGYYYLQCQDYVEQIKKYEAVTMHVNLCLNYGNGTIHCYNDTIVPLGCNLLNATKLIAKVKDTYWPAYEASFVDDINGVSNEHLYYWMWLYWDQNERAWKYGLVGADRYILEPDETMMWSYEIPGW